MSSDQSIDESPTADEDPSRHGCTFVALMKPDGEIVGLSTTVLRAFGVSRPDVLGATFDQLHCPPATDALRKQLSSLLASTAKGEESRARGLYTFADGTSHHLELDVLPIAGEAESVSYSALVGTDTTAHVRLEQEFSQFFERSSDLMAIATTDLRLSRVNASWQGVLGWTPAELQSMTLLELLHRDDVDATRVALTRLGRESSNENVEARFRRQNGEYRWIAVAAQEADGRLHMVGRDVTQRRLLQRNLSRVQRLEAVGEIAGGVAHDLNNALMAVLGFGELALSRLQKGDPLHEDLELVVAGARRANTVIRQLLTFARRQPVTPRCIDLNEACRNFDQLMRPILGSRIQTALALSPVPCPAVVDPGQLDQVLLNLVTNARDALPLGGRATLRTRHADHDAEYVASHHGAQAGPHVVVELEDTGVGIDPELTSRIFEPFFTTKPPDRGSGLGLPMVYGFVRQAGGFVWVHSVLKRGSRFELHFPLGVATVAPGDQPPATVDRPKLVLVVEHDQGVRNAVALTLERQHYAVMTAASDEEARRSVNTSGGKPDLWIVDASTSTRTASGDAAGSEREPFDRPVLFLVDDPAQPIGASGTKTSILTKPFTPEQLLARVDELIAS